MHSSGEQRRCLHACLRCSAHLALCSALQDQRFQPIAAAELPSLSCTVSFLSQREPARDCYDWVVGVHGIIITFRGSRSSLQARRELAAVLTSCVPARPGHWPASDRHLPARGGVSRRLGPAASHPGARAQGWLPRRGEAQGAIGKSPWRYWRLTVSIVCRPTRTCCRPYRQSGIRAQRLCCRTSSSRIGRQQDSKAQRPVSCRLQQSLLSPLEGLFPGQSRECQLYCLKPSCRCTAGAQGCSTVCEPLYKLLNNVWARALYSPRSARELCLSSNSCAPGVSVSL